MINYGILLSEQIGENIESAGELTDVLTGEGGINEILGSICQAIGAILLAVAIYKLIMSMKDSNSNDKAQASAMFGGGIAAFMINTILNNIHYEDVTGDADSMGVLISNVLGQMAQVMLIMGVILLAIGVFQLISSFLSEQAAEKENASRLMTTGAALIASKSVLSTISDKYVAAATERSARPFLELAMDVLIGFGNVAGTILFVLAVYQLVMAFKDEDLSAKHHAAVLMGVSLALLAFDLILYNFLPQLLFKVA